MPRNYKPKRRRKRKKKATLQSPQDNSPSASASASASSDDAHQENEKTESLRLTEERQQVFLEARKNKIEGHLWDFDKKCQAEINRLESNLEVNNVKNIIKASILKKQAEVNKLNKRTALAEAAVIKTKNKLEEAHQSYRELIFSCLAVINRLKEQKLTKKTLDFSIGKLEILNDAKFPFAAYLLNFCYKHYPFEKKDENIFLYLQNHYLKVAACEFDDINAKLDLAYHAVTQEGTREDYERGFLMFKSLIVDHKDARWFLHISRCISKKEPGSHRLFQMLCDLTSHVGSGVEYCLILTIYSIYQRMLPDSEIFTLCFTPENIQKMARACMASKEQLIQVAETKGEGEKVDEFYDMIERQLPTEGVEGENQPAQEGNAKKKGRNKPKKNNTLSATQKLKQENLNEAKRRSKAYKVQEALDAKEAAEIEKAAQVLKEAQAAKDAEHAKRAEELEIVHAMQAKSKQRNGEETVDVAQTQEFKSEAAKLVSSHPKATSKIKLGVNWSQIASPKKPTVVEARKKSASIQPIQVAPQVPVAASASVVSLAEIESSEDEIEFAEETDVVSVELYEDTESSAAETAVASGSEGDALALASLPGSPDKLDSGSSSASSSSGSSIDTNSDSPSASSLASSLGGAEDDTLVLEETKFQDEREQTRKESDSSSSSLLQESPVVPIPEDIQAFMKNIEERLGCDIILFGGANRDLYWGIPPRDYDFRINGSYEKLKALYKDVKLGPPVARMENYVTLTLNGKMLEIFVNQDMSGSALVSKMRSSDATINSTITRRDGKMVFLDRMVLEHLKNREIHSMLVLEGSELETIALEARLKEESILILRNLNLSLRANLSCRLSDALLSAIRKSIMALNTDNIEMSFRVRQELIKLFVSGSSHKIFMHLQELKLIGLGGLFPLPFNAQCARFLNAQMQSLDEKNPQLSSSSSSSPQSVHQRKFDLCLLQATFLVAAYPNEIIGIIKNSEELNALQLNALKEFYDNVTSHYAGFPKIENEENCDFINIIYKKFKEYIESQNYLPDVNHFHSHFAQAASAASPAVAQNPRTYLPLVNAIQDRQKIQALEKYDPKKQAFTF